MPFKFNTFTYTLHHPPIYPILIQSHPTHKSYVSPDENQGPQQMLMEMQNVVGGCMSALEEVDRMERMSQGRAQPLRYMSTT